MCIFYFRANFFLGKKACTFLIGCVLGFLLWRSQCCILFSTYLFPFLPLYFSNKLIFTSLLFFLLKLLSMEFLSLREDGQAWVKFEIKFSFLQEIIPFSNLSPMVIHTKLGARIISHLGQNPCAV